MEFELSEEQKQIKFSVREFAEAEIAPHVMEWDESQHFPVELLPKLAELGLLGVIFPEEYGGAGAGLVPEQNTHQGFCGNRRAYVICGFVGHPPCFKQSHNFCT